MGRCKKCFYTYLLKKKNLQRHTQICKGVTATVLRTLGGGATKMLPFTQTCNCFLIHGPAVDRIQDWIMSQYTFYPTLFLSVLGNFSIWSQRSKNKRIFLSVLSFCGKSTENRPRKVTVIPRMTQITNTILNCRTRSIRKPTDGKWRWLARLFYDRGPESSNFSNGSGPLGSPVLARAQGCQEGVLVSGSFCLFS